MLDAQGVSPRPIYFPEVRSSPVVTSVMFLTLDSHRTILWGCVTKSLFFRRRPILEETRIIPESKEETFYPCYDGCIIPTLVSLYYYVRHPNYTMTWTSFVLDDNRDISSNSDPLYHSDIERFFLLILFVFRDVTHDTYYFNV